MIRIHVLEQDIKRAREVADSPATFIGPRSTRCPIAQAIKRQWPTVRAVYVGIGIEFFMPSGKGRKFKVTKKGARFMTVADWHRDDPRFVKPTSFAFQEVPW